MNDFNWDSEKKTNSGFKTPDGYFDAFPQKLMQQLPAAEPKVISIWERNKKWIYGAVAVIALSVSIPVADYLRSDTVANPAEMEQYLSLHSTITDDDLIELISREAAENAPTEATIDNAAVEDALINNAYLEDYITD